MKRLAALAVIMMFVVSSTGCRRGLRLWGLRGAPCQPAPTAPAFGGGGGGLLGGLGQGGLGQGLGQAGAMGAPMPTTTCCPPIECPPIDCGCATGSAIDPGYAGMGMEGQIVGGQNMVKTFDSGMPLGPGETLAGVGPAQPQVLGSTQPAVPGTASAPSTGFAPANSLPALPSGLPGGSSTRN